MSALVSKGTGKLSPEVNRILFVRNLPYAVTGEELYTIFGKYGAIFQIRLGDPDKDTKGTAFVVYEDIYDAKNARENLNGFNVGGRYLIIQYYQPAKIEHRRQLREKEEEVQLLRQKVQEQRKRLGKD